MGKSCVQLGIPAATCIPLGMHGDGVPHQKHGSVECFSWNFAGLPASDRILFTIVDKRVCCKCGCGGRCTVDRILEIMCWSFRAIASATFPDCRHDGLPWVKSDKLRTHRTGSLKYSGLLCQTRGDWSWYKQIVSFPSWASHSICWKCKANTGTIPWRDCSLRAKWRTARTTDRSFFADMRANGVKPSPIFALPGMRLSFVGIDTLHICDLGVTQDLAGNVLWEFAANFAKWGEADRSSEDHASHAQISLSGDVHPLTDQCTYCRYDQADWQVP